MSVTAMFHLDRALRESNERAEHATAATNSADRSRRWITRVRLFTLAAGAMSDTFTAAGKGLVIRPDGEHAGTTTFFSLTHSQG
jgi:hypothetical protein